MSGQTLFIIRHAEKPLDPDGPPGLTPSGSPDASSLTIQGWQRAGAWATLFGSSLDANYPVPDTIYAADPSRSPDGGPPSHRPYQTVIPLAAKLGKGPRAHWAQGEEEALASDLNQQSGVTLVAWEHKRIISALLPRLLGPAVPGVPRKWQGHRFDVVFRLRRPDANASWDFLQLVPCLLGGDSDSLM